MSKEKFIYAQQFENINKNVEDKKNLSEESSNDEKKGTYDTFDFKGLWTLFEKNQNIFTPKNITAILIIANKHNIKELLANFHVLYDEFISNIRLCKPENFDKNKDLSSIFDLEKIKVRNILSYIEETSFNPIDKKFLSTFKLFKDTSSPKDMKQSDPKENNDDVNFVSKYNTDKEKFRQQTPKYLGCIDFANNIKEQNNIDQTKISLGLSDEERTDISTRHEADFDAKISEYDEKNDGEEES